MVKGKTIGTATITATASSGVTASCVVTVTREVASDRISLEVTNPYKDSQNNEYENTVLVGHDMNVRARVIINDQPLGNTNVTLKMTPVFGNSANAFEIRNNYVTTDENGYANFTIGLNNNNSALNAVNNRFQSYEVTASASDQSSSILVKFASISISNLFNENGRAGLGDPIEPSDTASPADDGLATTTSVNGAKTQEYVTSQKVSAADGTDDNTVYNEKKSSILKKATYTAKGKKQYKCTVCGKGEYTVTLPLIKLKAPKLKSVSKTGQCISVSWKKVTGASGYYIYRKSGKSKWRKIKTIKKSKILTYNDKSIKSGISYKYRIRAYNKAQKSNYSSVKSFK